MRIRFTTDENPEWYKKIAQFCQSQKITGETGMIDDGNIPVKISFRYDHEYGPWILSWHNYMPRKEMIWHEERSLTCQNDRPLRIFVKNFILPLYKNGFDAVNLLTKGKIDNVCFWGKYHE